MNSLYFIRKFYINERKNVVALTEVLEVISQIMEEQEPILRKDAYDRFPNGCTDDIFRAAMEGNPVYEEYKKMRKMKKVVEEALVKTKENVFEFENPVDIENSRKAVEE